MPEKNAKKRTNNPLYSMLCTVFSTLRRYSSSFQPVFFLVSKPSSSPLRLLSALTMASCHPKDEPYLNQVIEKRIKIFQSLQSQQQSHLQSLPHDPIKITLPDGSIKEGKKWVSSPMDIAQGISKSLAANALISSVNGVLWDMNRPLEDDCELKIFTFDSDEGRDTFWHSSAHILGQSLESIYGCKLCIGPCTTRGEGFYYDAFYADLGLNEDHFKQIEAGALKAVAEKQPFERIEVTREQAIEIFSENNFKVEIINDLPVDKTITVYRCGPLVDLCRGPHIPNTSFVKAFACLKASSAYWRGNKDRESLQRVYGISYPDQKRLKIEKQEFGLKPMNCPGHCLMFQHRVRSYRELPLRLADFGVLHRNEASGALTGLTRVRRFQQDDAHIFCRESQIKEEVKGVLEFIDYAYTVFGFTYELKLSTRPEKYLGDLATWERAEAALTEALNLSGKPWQINEGDGAFYGPKIDISVSDALNRKFQCATLQLDFQLPERFKLEYSAEDEAKREKPVMIHRAILGSVERMFAILLEHYKGKWPFWLSPRQAIVCPVSEKSENYAIEVQDRIHEAGYYVDIDMTDRRIQKKVREAQLAQYNYILVVGEEELETKQVSVRVRDKADLSTMSIEGLLQHFQAETAAFH
ncbi:threonine--tRNA ligase, mitochondrial 1-like isoform X3 [Durio zibethinus]|uniref:threonine--tRNA ligase n=1 Tax=Durio zibethinus TaxID=66656 RepID=A0A6P5Y097_DURZI|nr:threonine--tRNA ligase, mitochondrial 1-like isoform X3 [Durio zibethinus]